MVKVSVECPKCKGNIEVELPKNKSLIIKTCTLCGKDICKEDGNCITVCACPCPED